MKSFKKVLAVATSTLVLASTTVTAFADGPTSSEGTANILAYSLESVVVPTSLSVALNPQGYTVTTRAADGDTAAVTTTDQIVSINYGIANLSTAAKNVTVDFAVTGTAAENKTAITFVDSEEKAEAYDASTNANGAKAGELKMYLAVAAASAQPTTSAGADFAVTASTTNGQANTHNVTAANLTDCTMTVATSGFQAFAAGSSDYADSSIRFSLDEAEYSIIQGSTVDFSTTQTGLKELVQVKELGAVTGFTFTGKMNSNADWTTADVSALKFTPTYTIEDADGTETASGGYKQIEAAATSRVSASTISTTSNPVTLTLPDGVTVTSLVLALDGSNVTLVSGNHYTISGSTLTVTKYASSWAGGTITITYSDSVTETLTCQ